MTHPLKTPAKSLCILRLSAIGDVMHMLPILRTLQHSWPDCKITWIIDKLEASLVSDIPGVEFIIFDKSAGLKAYFRLRQQLRGRQFDLLLHMQVALRASLISLSINAPIKLGFDRTRAHDYQCLFCNHRIDAKPQQHVLDGFFGFLEKLGIHERCLEWNIPIPEEAESFVNQSVPHNKPLLLINPCSSARRRNWRNWPAERYAAVADFAENKLGMQVILSGGSSEQERKMASDISKLTQTPPINLVGKTSLKQLLALINRAKVLIAPDTGPTHMATATGTTVIGLYASSNPARTGPYLNQDLVINHYQQALIKYLHKNIKQARWGERVRHPDAMNLIQADEVNQKLKLVVGNS